MSQQFTKHRLNISERLPEYSEEDDEHSNNSEQYHNIYSIKSQAARILEENLNLQYTFDILEGSLNQLRKKQSEKQNQLKKWKEKIKNKSEKESDLRRHIDHIQKNKSRKLGSGYRNLHSELEEMKEKQKNIRTLRINAQEEKNRLYEKYIIMEEKYKEVISYLQELHGVEESLDDVERENKFLAERVDNIQRQIMSAQDKDKLKGQKTTRQRVKELNNRVKELEIEQNSLDKQIHGIELTNQELKNEQRVIKQKNEEIQELRKKIDNIKYTIGLKKSEFNHLDTTFKQLCVEESKLKKEQLLEKECLQEQKKYKQATNKKEKAKFQIVDSQSQDVSQRYRGSFSPKKKREGEDPEMNKLFEQYDRVSSRRKNKK